MHRTFPPVKDMYRAGRVRQAVEFLLHLLQDVCGGAVLRFAVVDLIQDSIEYLGKENKNIHIKRKSIQSGHIERQTNMFVN